MAHRKKRYDPIRDAAKSSRRAARDAHFANGGSPTMWIHPGSVIQDPKKIASRNACRERVTLED